jgi:hypothetical protein
MEIKYLYSLSSQEGVCWGKHEKSLEEFDDVIGKSQWTRSVKRIRGKNIARG